MSIGRASAVPALSVSIAACRVWAAPSDLAVSAAKVSLSYLAADTDRRRLDKSLGDVAVDTKHKGSWT